jgi:hypothetical protein
VDTFIHEIYEVQADTQRVGAQNRYDILNEEELEAAEMHLGDAPMLGSV